jgi:hypothetical protein
MIVTFTVSLTLFRGIYLIKPIVGNNLTGGIIYQTGVRVRSIGVSFNTPVITTGVF